MFFCEFITLNKYNLPILNSINWDIKISYSDEVKFGSANIKNIERLRLYVDAYLSGKYDYPDKYKQQFRQKFNNLKHKFDQEYNQNAGHEINYVLKQQLEQNLQNVNQEYEKFERNLTTIEREHKREILEQESKLFNFKYIKHLSDDELEEFKNIFILQLYLRYYRRDKIIVFCQNLDLDV
ncbi:hypothetical protein K493DRAFT_308697 [Basidiobolus meristosporus CBS 931.73]|uniref:Uncharacterized protein n=1 Tax=Basidiobolus meristosporus CBS 931.73 TaxID=1314790 RepID=A0A1Y1WYJ9_9FUNG|nr:hypothetical protein K493DRAFT_308697 [Basidiobolus meristosporus CBS 931.73]|eukprot:ORX78502.1 hypothetical protein K493DRAFT_308697 [Basidiobolus meristosporus CBS 931.73]